jgi:hypothetical protein
MEIYNAIKAALESERLVCWFGRTRLEPVASVHPHGNPDESNDDWEPGPIATLKSGGYVALDHCEMSDFCEMRPLQSNDKEQNHE